VLLVFATREVRYRQPPYAPWVGLETDRAAVARRLARLDALVDDLGLGWASDDATATRR
jgi:hypothetical protein